MESKIESTLLQIGIALMWRSIFGKDNSAEVEAKLFATNTKKETVEVLAGAAVAAVTETLELPVEAEDALMAMTTAHSKEELEDLINSPKNKANILDIIWGILTLPFGIFK